MVTGSITKWALVDSAPINRITNLFENLFATGDDDGVIKVCLDGPHEESDTLLIAFYDESCGIIDSLRWLENIRITGSTSLTSRSWKTKSNLSLHRQ